jgi:hypothetical protein
MFLPLFSVIVFTVSCATMPYEPYAREVKKKPSDGGVIALHANYRPEDRSKADLMMQSNCAGGTVKVTEEGEVVVGEKTDATAKKTYESADSGWKWGAVKFGSASPSDNTQTSSQTTQLKEWHISYSCVAAAETQHAAPVAKKGRRKNPR